MTTEAPKRPRNVNRDTACPKCGKLFVKNALRMHEPWCGRKQKNGDGAGKPAAQAGGEPRMAPPAPSPTPSTKKAWLYD